METQLLKADEKSLRLGAELIKKGQVVAFPTETVYGLGANALDDAAVRAIFAAKERPADNPLIVHITVPEALEGLCGVPSAARELMDAFWPGPLTMLMPKTDKVPDVTTAGLPTVAVRCPSHPDARALIDLSGLPIAAPSANRSGRPSPTNAAHVYEDMNGRIPLILDGGPSLVGVESTVLDVTGEVPCILRPGAVTPEMVKSVVGKCTVADSVMRPLKEGESAPSPGMRHRHYAPRAKMTVFTGDRQRVIREILRRYDEDGNACILCHTPDVHEFGDRRVLTLGATPEETAHNLFTRLRETDETGCDLILAMGWEGNDITLAVMNRMARAAAFDLVKC